jgi:hypothetical protein
MADSTNTIWMPKDMKKCTAAVTRLDPGDWNNVAFKMVTILVLLVCHKTKTVFPFFQ